ncbi:hypothetical protein BKE38_03965 [Pseudoroseomonas deserti]|uniref:Uncharacterized protein n=1 Tax=Teichococcus deserti TaxID=1817963 RepID=A0A1V2H6U9_9PROT|nr:hypothetical protein [Pseudoroseomonas deserti]ONG57877.1 hypothetical protein BKE38_03965 [Pseudoroseomonas deserti]
MPKFATTALTAAALTPFEDLRRWDDEVRRLTRGYGKAKQALARQPGCQAAAAAFDTAGRLLMEAMQERHRRETVLAAMRRLFRMVP